jgi:signal transduction histidine kinase
LRIEVHDTGAGISAADQERLFLPFEGGDRSWAKVPEGMGLGLAICRELAAAMGGHIGVSNRLERAAV